METRLRLQLSALATSVELSGLEQRCENLTKQASCSLSFAPWTKQLNEHYSEWKLVYVHYSFFFFFLTPNRSFQITAPPTAQTPPFSKVTKNHHVPPVRNSALSCFYSASEWSMKLFKVPRKHQSQKHRTGDFQVVPSQDMSALPHLLQESYSSTFLHLPFTPLFSIQTTWSWCSTEVPPHPQQGLGRVDLM